MIPELIQTIFEAGRMATSADNLQPWHFFWDGQQITLAYDDQRVAGKTFTEDNPATLLGIGSVIENMTQAAKSAGVTIHWVFFEENQQQNGYAQGQLNIDISQFEWVRKSKTSMALYGRHTNRLAYKKEALPGDVLNRINSMQLDTARVQVHDDVLDIKVIADLVYRCSTVRFQTREVHEWLGRSFRFTKEEVSVGDGLDVATIGLPPGGTYFLKFIKDWQRMSFLNKLGGYRLLAKMDADLVRRSAAMISIVAGSERQAIINAGRLMTRVWIELNELGIAAQPYFVITDQLTRLKEKGVPESLTEVIVSVKQECSTVFNLKKGECLLMLLRVGLPKSDPVRSKRLANAFISTDLDKN